MKKIAVEEHFWTEEYVSHLRSRKEYPRLETVEDEKHYEIDRMWPSAVHTTILKPDMRDRLLDTGEGRLREMDETGIDMAVLTLSTGFEQFDASEGTAMAKRSNDQLSRAVKEHPKRFAGFAALAPQDPGAAADELERAVKVLGLKGAKIHSNIRGEYLDDEKYWAIFERAEKLAVPIYLHPTHPSPDMMKSYSDYPVLAAAMWGFGAETGLHAMRLILSGVFDEYPGLKIILGHLGEALPFWLWRIDNRWAKGPTAADPLARKLEKKPSQYVKDNFLVTTSGMFWQPALLCAYLALGADRILFAVDYPYESNREAVEFMEMAPICDSDKEKIFHLNAEKLLA
jgi:2,3-dihydroxybenzoate decarboxylase